MNFVDKAAIGVCALGIAFVSYAKIWEYQQPLERIDDAVVMKIEKGCYDLYSPSHHCHHLFVTDAQKEVIFWRGQIDEPVNVGGSVDLVVRKNFFSPESFHGIEITLDNPKITRNH